MSKLPTLPTTETIGPRPKLPTDRMPTLYERRQSEGPAPRVQRKPTAPPPAGERPRFVNRAGHILQPAEGTVKPPEQLTAADSAPGTRLDKRFPAMKPTMWMGKRSPIIRANRTPKDEPAPKRAGGMTLGDRIRAEGVAAQLEKKRKKKGPRATPPEA